MFGWKKPEKIKRKTVLAIGAHPDDIEYWAGGTMLKLTKRNELIYIVATNGEIGGRPSVRKREQKQAARLVGVKKLIFLDYPDSELEAKRVELQRDLLEIFLKEKPDLVFSFDPENQFCLQVDTHPDHRVLSLMIVDLVLIHSTLPAYIKKMELGLEPLKSRPELWLFNPKNPNYFEDISLLWEQKIRLLRSFRSQNLKIGGSKTEAFRRIGFCSKI